MDWYGIKQLAVEQTGLSRDALHVIVGFGAQLLVAALIRRPLSSPLPWLAVLLGECANEYYDLHREVWTDRDIWPGSLGDILVTMAIPTLILVLCRYTPGLFRPLAHVPSQDPS